jgi:outer membrane lipoprotein-sorting protein
VLCLAALVACVGSPLFALPTADELLKTITEKASTVKTMQADTTTTVSAPQGDMKGAGQIFTAKSDVNGKTVHKSLMTIKLTTEAGRETGPGAADVKIVNDGKFVWQEMRVTVPMPMVQVIKTTVGQKGPMGAPAGMTDDPVKQLREQFEFTGVSEDTIDGRKMYVLEGKPKVPPQGISITTVKCYADEESLMLRRMVMLDEADKELTRFDLTNVKINEKLDPKMFDYTPPDDARIVDRTKDEADK